MMELGFRLFISPPLSLSTWEITEVSTYKREDLWTESMKQRARLEVGGECRPWLVGCFWCIFIINATRLYSRLNILQMPQSLMHMSFKVFKWKQFISILFLKCASYKNHPNIGHIQVMSEDERQEECPVEDPRHSETRVPHTLLWARVWWGHFQKKNMYNKPEEHPDFNDFLTKFSASFWVHVCLGNEQSIFYVGI